MEVTFTIPNNINVTGNTVTGNWVGVYLYDTNNNNVTGNNLTDNGAGITHYNSIGIVISGNNFTDNWLTDTSVIDSGEVVMATTIYTCGPAALATILKNLGIYTTEAELTELAGTDETGTSLYGLKTAAEAKGATAIGARLTIDQLKTNYLVVLSINGANHFEVIQNITDTTVYLFDPNLGNIEMTLNKFNELYTGIALIINDQPPTNATLLTPDEMRDIKANGYIRVPHTYWIPGYIYYTYHYVSFKVTVPYFYTVWVPSYKLWGLIPIPGHHELRIGIRTVNYGYWIPIPHIVLPRKVTYYTYQYVEVKVNQARQDFMFDLSWTALGIALAPPSSGTSLAATLTTAPSLVRDISRNYNAIFYGGSAMEAYVDGKLRMKQEWFNIEIFDYNGKQVYPYSNPLDNFYQQKPILPN